MQDTPDTPDERRQRRRARRWKRRARILAPFLGVLLLLAALSFSVDLVEYQPQPKPDQLADRPIRMIEQGATQPTMQPSLLITTQANSATPITPDDANGMEGAKDDSIQFDVMLPPTPFPRSPTPPYAAKLR